MNQNVPETIELAVSFKAAPCPNGSKWTQKKRKSSSFSVGFMARTLSVSSRQNMFWCYNLRAHPSSEVDPNRALAIGRVWITHSQFASLKTQIDTFHPHGILDFFDERPIRNLMNTSFSGTGAKMAFQTPVLLHTREVYEPPPRNH